MTDHGEHHEAAASHPAAEARHEAATSHAPADHAGPANHTGPSSHSAPVGPGGNSSFSRGVNRARTFERDAASRIFQTGQRVKGAIGRVLRFDQKAATETGWVKTPFYAAGHLIDGTVLNVARRGYEVAEPLVSGMRAAYRSTIGAVLSPIRTLTSPVEYLKNPLRIATSVATAALNVVRSPVRAIDDLVERGIKNTIQQVTFKVAKIPAIGTLLAKPSGFIAGIASKISNAVRNAMDWVTSPIDTVHNALAPA